jgi:hypothetical protein
MHRNRTMTAAAAAAIALSALAAGTARADCADMLAQLTAGQGYGAGPQRDPNRPPGVDRDGVNTHGGTLPGQAATQGRGVAGMPDQSGQSQAGQGRTAQGGAAQGQGGGVSKDGTLAPLQEGAGATTGAQGQVAGQGEPGRGQTTGEGTRQGSMAQGQATGRGGLDQMQGGGTGQGVGVAKDGTIAPLQEGPGQAGQGRTAQGQGGVGVGSGVATSQEEAEAQQRGGGAPGTADTAHARREAALERARAAYASGDEAGCMRAVEEVRRLDAG